MNSVDLLYKVIVSENTGAGLLLVCVILAMAFVGVCCAISHRARYVGAETGYLNQARGRLENLQKPAAKPETTEGAENKAEEAETSHFVSAENLAGLASSVPMTSIIGDRLAILVALRKSKTKVNLAALQQISRAHEAARVSLRFPGLAVNLLMLLGLLGTFIGIAVVIHGIAENAREVGPSLTGLGSAFNGMYTKFSTTITGLTCTIILALLNFRLAQAQERFFEALDRFTVTELLPATVPALDDQDLLERITDQLDQSFTLIQDIADKNAKTVDQVAAIQTGFTDIVGSLRQQVRVEGPDRLQNLLGQTAGVIDQVSRVNSTLQELATALPKTLTASNQKLYDAIVSRGEPTGGPHSDPADKKWSNAIGLIALTLSVLVLVVAFVVKG